MKQSKKYIYIAMSIFILLFVVMIGYLVYFTAFKSEQIAIHPNNKRMDNLEKEMVRGNIYDTNKIVLATTTDVGREYPFGSLYVHAVGYTGAGKTGTEAFANTELLRPDYNVKALFENTFQGKPFNGRDVVLTLDHDYQKAIGEAMEDCRGAAVVIEANTGKIKALYSSPAFNPNKIVANWENLISDDERTPLVNRATNGLYPPGSIFKVVTALGYMQSLGEIEPDFRHTCTGKIEMKGYTVQCYNQKAHGDVGLKEAFTQSCNTYFVALRNKMSVATLSNTAEQLGFNKPLYFDMDYTKSKFQLQEDSEDFEKSLTYIGQGKTLVSPLHMAMLASAIANDGILMKPYLFDYSMTKGGRIKVKTLPKVNKMMIDEKLAVELQQMMQDVVKKGTGTRLNREDIVVGGKSGTAENETGKDHSWFIGFAEKDGKTESPIAFAVIVENGGEGSLSQNVIKKILNVYSDKTQ